MRKSLFARHRPFLNHHHFIKLVGGKHLVQVS
jgi:hypothetical protein